MHNLRWDDLQFVLSLAEHRSLSGAARALGVNHTTVLRRIEALEAQMGVRVFDRPPGGYRLRAEAQEMLGTLRSVGRTVERIERAMRAQGAALEGRIRLTTTDSVADLLLPRHLAALAESHPRLSIDLAVTNRPLDMGLPEAELTVRPTRSLPEGLEGRSVAPMHFAVYRATSGGSERWLGAAPPLTRSPVGPWQDLHLDQAPRLSADSFLTLARMAAQGLGRAVLPCFVGDLNAALERVRDEGPVDATQVWVAAHPDLMRLDQVRALVDFFADALAEDAGLLAGDGVSGG